MTKSVKHSGAGGGNGGGGLNEDDFNDMYGTKYLGPDDVKKPTATMTDAVDKEIFDRPDGRSEAKVLLHFKAFRKPLPCNKTNALNLASAYGKNPADWVGKAGAREDRANELRWQAHQRGSRLPGRPQRHEGRPHPF